MPRVASERIPEGCSAGAIAAVLGVTERVVTARRQDGRLPRLADGRIDLHAVISAGVAALAKQQRSGDGEELDLTAERARLAKEQADAQEMKNAITRGELVPQTDIVAGMQVSFAYARARLLSMPAKIAPRIVGITSLAEVRDIVTDHVHECCAELSATRAIPTDAGRPAHGGGGDGGDGGMGAAAEADGKRVGRSVPRPQRRGRSGAGPVANRSG